MKINCPKFKTYWFIQVALIISIGIVTARAQNAKTKPSFSQIEAGFKTVPDSVQTSVYWYWMSDNISKEGVIKDLNAMKRAGINRAFIGNIGGQGVPYGKVKIFSDE